MATNSLGNIFKQFTTSLSQMHNVKTSNFIKKYTVNMEAKTAEVLTAVVILPVSQVQKVKILRSYLTQNPWKFNK